MVSKCPWKLWFHANQVVPDHLQILGPAYRHVQEEPWEEKAPLGAAQEAPGIPLQSESQPKRQSKETQHHCETQETQPFPESEDDAEFRDKGSLPQPLVTKVESQVFSEKLTTGTSTFESTSKLEGTLEQQQRNPKVKRMRRSPVQEKCFRHMIFTHKKTPTGKTINVVNVVKSSFFFFFLILFYF